MIRIVLRTFGCRVNQAEAFAWAEALQRRGLRLMWDARRGDIVVVNSCTLTARADRDVRRFLVKTARENPGAAIVVTGCLAERAAGALEGLPGVRLIVGNAGKDELVERVLALAAELEAAKQGAAANPVIGTGWANKEVNGTAITVKYTAKVDGTEIIPFRSRALLKIQDGCDSRCAYCIIPSVRGPARSIPPDEIEASVRRLAGAGFHEIVLAGIHLSSYGAGLRPRSSFLDLLARLEAVEGDWMLRLSSLDLRSVDDALLDRLVSSPRICGHFHLSLQHVSPGVLRDMGRPFPDEEARRILDRLRAGAPDAALGADVIAGFPTEADEDFEILREFVEGSTLNYLHVFPFSPRPGTTAAGLRPLPEATVARRAAALRSLSNRLRTDFRRSLIGREFGGVVVRAGGGAREVLTGNYVRVAVPDCPAPPRERVTVRITGLTDRGAAGFVVDDPPASTKALEGQEATEAE